MLVLHRKKSQSIMVGDDIEIIVHEISGDSVRLAIEAPREVKVFRKELIEAAKVNEEAVTSKTDIERLKELSTKLIKKV